MWWFQKESRTINFENIVEDDKLEDVDLPLVPNVGAAKIERVIKGRHKDKGEGVSK